MNATHPALQELASSVLERNIPSLANSKPEERLLTCTYHPCSAALDRTCTYPQTPRKQTRSFHLCKLETWVI